MAHLSFQVGAALVVPFTARSRQPRGGQNWRVRALREATSAGRDGSRGSSRNRRGRAVSPSARTGRRALPETAEE